MNFYFVYILKLSNKRYYVGFAKELERRLREHENGQVLSTKRYLPLKIVGVVGFITKKKAIIFEKYLKTGSGIAFRNRHLV